MSNGKGKPDNTPAAVTTAIEEAKEKVYEVVHSLSVVRGHKVTLLGRGAEVLASEIAGDAERLLTTGVISDPEAPVNAVTTDLAHDRLTGIAQKLGLLTRKGANWLFGERRFVGQKAYRDGVTLDELEAAIVGFAQTPPVTATPESTTNEPPTKDPEKKD